MVQVTVRRIVHPLLCGGWLEWRVCVQVVKVWPERGAVQVYNPKGQDKLFTYDAAYDCVADTQTIYDEMVSRPISMMPSLPFGAGSATDPFYGERALVKYCIKFLCVMYSHAQ